MRPPARTAFAALLVMILASSGTGTASAAVTSSPDGRSGKQLATPFSLKGETEESVPLISKVHWVSRAYVPSVTKRGLTADADAQFGQMTKAAASNGYTLTLVSSYRSYAYQDKLWKQALIDHHTCQEAAQYHARAGQSEHQLGLTVDVSDGTELSSSFDSTKLGEWMRQNSYKYGWIPRYPKDKELITGYAYEPWQYRYIGVAEATKFHDGTWLTLEEYLHDDAALTLMKPTLDAECVSN